jgi:hypothetical protein
LSGLCTNHNHNLTTSIITTALGPSKTLHVYLTISSQGVFESATIGVYHTQGIIPQRSGTTSHRIARIHPSSQDWAQADTINGGIELLKS